MHFHEHLYALTGKVPALMFQNMFYQLISLHLNMCLSTRDKKINSKRIYALLASSR